jgi:hypothetical protein
MSGFDHPIQPCSFTASVPAFDSNNDYAGAHLCPLFFELTGEKTYKSTSATIANEPSIETRRTTHVGWICAVQTRVRGPDSASPLSQHQHQHIAQGLQGITIVSLLYSLSCYVATSCPHANISPGLTTGTYTIASPERLYVCGIVQLTGVIILQCTTRSNRGLQEPGFQRRCGYPVPTA